MCYGDTVPACWVLAMTKASSQHYLTPIFSNTREHIPNKRPALESLCLGLFCKLVKPDEDNRFPKIFSELSLDGVPFYLPMIPVCIFKTTMTTTNS